ncbi:hypothetical protein SDC9_176039 [bioreactor metagenome]|uniref:Uncharacterized protein n=1 Tax=bioreactor metagenome TaxID=1076179 RepID=A0A645GP09_9ZZZZ
MVRPPSGNIDISREKPTQLPSFIMDQEKDTYHEKDHINDNGFKADQQKQGLPVYL